MTRITIPASEAVFRDLQAAVRRTAGRGPGPTSTRQRPPDQGKPAQPAGQGAPSGPLAARSADPARKAAAPAASSARPDRAQPAKAEDQAPTMGDDDRLDELR